MLCLGASNILGSGVPQSILVADTPPSTSCLSSDAVAEPAADGAPSPSSALDTDLTDDMHDAAFIDDIIDANAADPFFADRKALQACLSLRIFGGRKAHIVICRILQTASGWSSKLCTITLLPGHFGIANTITAINRRFSWRNAHQEVCDLKCDCICHCPELPGADLSFFQAHWLVATFERSIFCLAYCHH